MVPTWKSETIQAFCGVHPRDLALSQINLHLISKAKQQHGFGGYMTPVRKGRQP